MSSLITRQFYKTDYCTGRRYLKTVLKSTSYDNQYIEFFNFGRYVCTRGGEELFFKNVNNIWDVFLVFKGNAQFMLGKEILEIRENDIVIGGPEDALRARVPKGIRLEICHLAVLDNPVTRLLLSRLHQERRVHTKEPDEIRSLLSMLEGCLERNMNGADRMCLKELSIHIYALFSEIMRQCLDFESRLSVPQVKNELEHNPGGNYDLSELARSCGLSERSFERQFKELTGCSFRLYLTGCRIGLACRLLRTTKYSTSEVAALCNFRSLSYFYKIFRRHTGETPCTMRARTTARSDSELACLLARTDQKADELTDTRKTMLWQILQNRRITITEMAERLSIHRSAVQKNIEWLKNNGFIMRRGSRRNGYWHFQAAQTIVWDSSEEKK